MTITVIAKRIRCRELLRENGSALHNSFMAYKNQIDPLCPVVIKKGQNEVHAPAHETWDTVTCKECGDVFFIGSNRIFGSRISAAQAAKRLEDLLDADHTAKEKHQNSYELPD